MCTYTELFISVFTFKNISIYQLSLVSSLSLLWVLVLWQTRTEKQKSLRTEMYLCGLQTCLQLPVSRNVRGKGLWLPPLKNLCAVHLTKTNIKLQFLILLNNFYMQKYQKNIFDSNSFRKTRTLIIFFFNLFVFGPMLFVALGDLWTLSAFVRQHREQRIVADGKRTKHNCAQS